MNYFDLMKAITYAHVEAQGLGSVPKGADGVSGQDQDGGNHLLRSASESGRETVRGHASPAASGHTGPGNAVARGLSADSQISASVIPGVDSRNAGREGTVAASPAVPSFQGLTIERLIADVERIQDEHSAD